MANRRNQVLAQVSRLGHSLESGDSMVGGTFGQAGPFPWWERPVKYLALAIWTLGLFLLADSHITGRHIQGGLLWMFLAPGQLLAVTAAYRKPTYIALTTRYVYLIRLTTTGRKAERVELQTPATCLRIVPERAGRSRRVVRLEGADFPLTGLQFRVDGDWRGDLDAMVAALPALILQ